MLKALRVKNFILIDSLEINFPAGLVIITGETGAGKSILLGAISLLMGEKADASFVGPAGDTCVVEGEFDCSADTGLEALCSELDLPWCGGDLTIRRVVSASGRSRCFLCDEPVSKDALGAIASRLIDIHSQHQTLQLGDPFFRISVLDAYAGCTGLRAEHASIWKDLMQLRREGAALEEQLAKIELEREFNEALFRQLEDARLRTGELEELETEQKMLANAEEIKLSLLKAEAIMNGSEEIPSFTSSLKELSKLLSKVSSYVPAAEALAGRVESAKAELEDILSEIEGLEEHVDVSKERLQAIEDRLSLLYSLMTKHSVRTVEELIGKRELLSGVLFNSEELVQKHSAIQKKISDLEARLAAVSAGLHDKRSAAAGKFASAVTKSLQELCLESASFGVEVSAAAPGVNGSDAVTFLFSATGSNLKDVAKSASGGELSRIMLSVKGLMARYSAMPTMIFDEIDTGISGGVADAIGTMICRMGEDMQVFAITHLPQVAAKGNAHLLVTKEMAAGRAISRIKKIESEERVGEIARMLSGSVITPEAKANAEALLRNNPGRK